MLDLDIVFVYHYTLGKSNKIWGIIKQSENVYYAFWGRVGKKLQFQDFPPYMEEMHKKAAEKMHKGYLRITSERLDELQDDFDSQFLMAVLGGAKAKVDWHNPGSRPNHRNID